MARPGVKGLSYVMVYGIRYTVYCIWYMVYVMVYGIWYMVYGIWYMLYVICYVLCVMLCHACMLYKVCFYDMPSQLYHIVEHYAIIQKTMI